MARIRSVHPELCRDDTLPDVSAEAERTFIRLWPHLDDDGRAIDNARLLKADLYPLHDHVTAEDVDRDLDELAAKGLVIRYQVDGKRYLTAKPDTWKQYQRPRHPTPSKLPSPEEGSVIAPEDDAGPTADRRNAPEDVGKAPAGVVVGVGEGVGGGRPGTPPAPGGQRAPDLLFDAVCAVCGVDPQNATNDERGRVNNACKQLRAVNATPEDVQQRALLWRRKFPEAHLTPQSLTKSWSSLAGNRRSVQAARCAECGQPLGEAHTPESCARKMQIMGRSA